MGESVCCALYYFNYVHCKSCHFRTINSIADMLLIAFNVRFKKTCLAPGCCTSRRIDLLIQFGSKMVNQGEVFINWTVFFSGFCCCSLKSFFKIGAFGN